MNLLAVSLGLNFIMGITSIIIFYKLSKVVLSNERMSFKAAILFTINPATVFHLAPYTASAFSVFTFFGFYMFFKHNPRGLPSCYQILMACLPLCFAVGIRSNGLFYCIIVGFVIFLKLVCLLKSSSNFFLKILKLGAVVIFGLSILAMFISVFVIVLYEPYLSYC